MSERNYPFALPLGTDISGYVIEHVIGAGGFGITYRATNPVTGVTVAIKEFYPQGFASRAGATVILHDDVSSGSYETALKKFEQEAAKLTGRYRHPNIVQGVNFLRMHNTAYFVMEFIEGCSFDQWLNERATFADEAELRAIFERVLDAVEYIHAQNGMHRDLTPKNIMVRPNGEPVLVDFGASGEGLDTERFDSTAFAQPNYAPPEQLTADDGRMQGRHTDIFSLGGVLYRSVTGRPPVKPLKRSHDVAIHGRANDPYVPAALGARDPLLYSAAFLDGIDQALRLDYRERPNTIQAFREALGWADEATVPVVSTRRAGEAAEAVPRHRDDGRFGEPVPASAAAPRILAVAPDALAAAPPVHAPDFDGPPRAGRKPTGPIPRPGGAGGAADAFEAPARPARSRRGLVVALLALVAMLGVGTVALFGADAGRMFNRLLGATPQVTAVKGERGPLPDAPKPPATPDGAARPTVDARPPEAPKPPEKLPDPPPEKPVDWAEFAGFSAVGRETAEKPDAKDPEACRRVCQDDRSCQGFAVSATKVCTLYAEVGSIAPDPAVKLVMKPGMPAQALVRDRVDTEAKRRAAFKTVDGVSLPGGQVPTRLIGSQAQCAFACQSEASCKAWVHQAAGSSCRLLSTLTPADAAPAVGVVTGVEDPDGKTVPAIRRSVLAKTRTAQAFTGVDLTGQVIGRDRQPDALACRQSCLGEQTCVAAVQSDGECLRFGKVEDVRKRQGAEVFVDVRQTALATRIEQVAKEPDNPRGTPDLFTGFEAIGTPLPSDRTPDAQTADDCQRICSEAGGCAGYSFSNPDRRCQLLAAPTDVVPDATRVAGLYRSLAGPVVDLARRRAQLSEQSRPNFQTLRPGCVPDGAATTTPLGTRASAEQCAFLCRSGQSCQAWAFMAADRSCQLYTSITGVNRVNGASAGLFDPTGRRAEDLERLCAGASANLMPPAAIPGAAGPITTDPGTGPLPPAGIGPGGSARASECDRLAGYIYDTDLPRNVVPKLYEHIDPARAIAVCSAVAAAQPQTARWKLALGRALEREGREVDARAAYREAADQGSAAAAFLYGIMLDKGQGGPEDDAEAERYFRLSKQRGFAPAGTALALLETYSDRVTPSNDQEFINLLIEAANRGHAPAMYRLGDLFERGKLNRRFVFPDSREANVWFQRAFAAFSRDADQKDAQAMRFLSLLYDGGRGVPRSTEQALKWLVQYLQVAYGPDNVVARRRATIGDVSFDEWSTDTKRALQNYLNQQGASIFPVDGIVGGQTRDAIERWLGVK
jgi:serine/threonine protein kinase